MSWCDRSLGAPKALRKHEGEMLRLCPQKIVKHFRLDILLHNWACGERGRGYSYDHLIRKKNLLFEIE